MIIVLLLILGEALLVSVVGAIRSSRIDTKYSAPLFWHPEYFRFVKIPSNRRDARDIEAWLTKCCPSTQGLRWQCHDLHGTGYLLYVPGGSGPTERYSEMVERVALAAVDCYRLHGRVTVR